MGTEIGRSRVDTFIARELGIVYWVGLGDADLLDGGKPREDRRGLYVDPVNDT